MLLEPHGDDPAWPWAAERDHELTALRIPVTTRNEGNFLVAFDVESEARPTNEENSLIVAFTQFIRSTDYTFHVQELMAAKAFDYDGGRNTILLHKYAEDSWGYRRFAWESTPFFVPDPRVGNGPEPLLKVLHRAEGGPAWDRWLAGRPELSY